MILEATEIFTSCLKASGISKVKSSHHFEKDFRNKMILKTSEIISKYGSFYNSIKST